MDVDKERERMSVWVVVTTTFMLWGLPLRGRHQSSIYPARGEEWQERTAFIKWFSNIINDAASCVPSIGLL